MLEQEPPHETSPSDFNRYDSVPEGWQVGEEGIDIDSLRREVIGLEMTLSAEYDDIYGGRSNWGIVPVIGEDDSHVFGTYNVVFNPATLAQQEPEVPVLSTEPVIKITRKGVTLGLIPGGKQ